MSTCISRHGEFSSHDLDELYVCKLCGVLDENALLKELKQLRKRIKNIEKGIASPAIR